MSSSNRIKYAVRNTIIGSFAPVSFISAKKPRMRVAAFHDIPTPAQDDFSAQILWLKENYNLVSLGDLFDRKNLNEHRTNVAITFDDGFKEHKTLVVPLFKKLGIPATFFICSGALGISGDAAQDFSKERLRRSRLFEFMDAADVKDLSRESLFEIGGHTTHHTDLGTELSAADIDREIVADKKALENIVGKPLRFFAYPFGGAKNISAPAKDALTSAGYLASFTIMPSFWSGLDDTQAIGRNSILIEDSPRLRRNYLSGGYDMLTKIKNIFS